MTTDQDWRELIDGSFGDGPGHRPVADRLVAGRRALRRRRIGVAAVAVAVAVGVSGAAWGVLPSEPRSGGPVVNTPDDRSGQLDDAVSSGADLVTWTGSEWEVAPGWTVLDRVNNPTGYELPRRSVAMELRRPSQRLFVLATDDGRCCSGETHMPVPAGTTLEEWLPAQVDNVRETDGEPVSKPVRFGAGETLVAAEGVTIVDQVPHPDLPANFAGPDDRTAAALIEVNGKQRFVLVRETYGKTEIIPFTGSFPSLKKFLRYAERQYAGEGGLR